MSIFGKDHYIKFCINDVSHGKKMAEGEYYVWINLS